ncbi:hypothetical protein CEXT_557091 [Caerostris extrusa]|uniref:Uncharacterized protein n=1 Tax=Caerostris extrusa TaxID=172846 RepID=A0AAV4MP55_CAEEX|nr:hypothetical protein CEXT_557091 [Caerostris extrusa]
MGKICHNLRDEVLDGTLNDVTEMLKILTSKYLFKSLRKHLPKWLGTLFAETTNWNMGKVCLLIIGRRVKDRGLAFKTFCTLQQETSNVKAMIFVLISGLAFIISNIASIMMESMLDMMLPTLLPS